MDAALAKTQEELMVLLSREKICEDGYKSMLAELESLKVVQMTARPGKHLQECMHRSQSLRGLMKCCLPTMQ